VLNYAGIFCFEDAMSDENLSHLMLEQFRLIRKQIDDLREEVRGYKAEMVAMRHVQRGFDIRQDHHTEDLVSLQHGSTALNGV
jgi:hypothetical protein